MVDTGEESWKAGSPSPILPPSGTLNHLYGGKSPLWMDTLGQMKVFGLKGWSHFRR